MQVVATSPQKVISICGDTGSSSRGWVRSTDPGQQREESAKYREGINAEAAAAAKVIPRAPDSDFDDAEDKITRSREEVAGEPNKRRNKDVKESNAKKERRTFDGGEPKERKN